MYSSSINYNNIFINTYSSDPLFTKKISNNFVANNPILKLYGPLTLDINNINYSDGIFLIPILNVNYKPLFLAINCTETLFNIKANKNWKGWFDPFFTYEINILNDFCDFTTLINN